MKHDVEFASANNTPLSAFATNSAGLVFNAFINITSLLILYFFHILTYFRSKIDTLNTNGQIYHFFGHFSSFFHLLYMYRRTPQILQYIL